MGAPLGLTPTLAVPVQGEGIHSSLCSKMCTKQSRKSTMWDRLGPQLVELTVFALTLLGPSGGVATHLRWARAPRADRPDAALGASPRASHDNARTRACDRGAPGAQAAGAPAASAPPG